MVPVDLQDLVYKTVKLRTPNEVNATWAPWWRAQAEAERSVLLQVYPDKADLVESRHIHAMQFADTLESGEKQ